MKSWSRLNLLHREFCNEVNTKKIWSEMPFLNCNHSCLFLLLAWLIGAIKSSDSSVPTKTFILIRCWKGKVDFSLFSIPSPQLVEAVGQWPQSCFCWRFLPLEGVLPPGCCLVLLWDLLVFPHNCSFMFCKVPWLTLFCFCFILINWIATKCHNIKFQSFIECTHCG